MPEFFLLQSGSSRYGAVVLVARGATPDCNEPENTSASRNYLIDHITSEVNGNPVMLPVTLITCQLKRDCLRVKLICKVTCIS